MNYVEVDDSRQRVFLDLSAVYLRSMSVWQISLCRLYSMLISLCGEQTISSSIPITSATDTNIEKTLKHSQFDFLLGN